MARLTLVFILSLGIASAAAAQTQADCTTRFNNGVASYNSGNYYRVVSVLGENCLEVLSADRLLKSYKMLIESYKRIDDDDKANSLYQRFKALPQNSDLNAQQVQQRYNGIQIE